MAQKIENLTDLDNQKIFFEKEAKVISFFTHHADKKSVYETLNDNQKVIFLQLIMLGYQSHLIQYISNLNQILEDFTPAHQFFDYEGGLYGYHKEIKKLLEEDFEKDLLTYHGFNGFDIRQMNKEVKKAIIEAITKLPEIAEMYAIGGAADRLNLNDEKTGKELPAACLKLNGKTLIEYLIQDVEAKEYLYFKLFGKRPITPIALMTSKEKQNQEEIFKLFEQHQWFGRPKDSFYFFDQPLVPVVDREGNFQFLEDGRPFLKPGGHGVIWKLAQECGVLDKLKSCHIRTLLIRQINNPIAGIDFGLLAFVGSGLLHHKKFGFASCERLIGSAEGMNVLMEKNHKGEKHFALTNVEYCDFKKYGISDEAKEEGSPYSKFSSNTNILFADISSIEKAVETLALPGKILNFKPMGQKKKEQARLETMMQNIADAFEENSKEIKNSFLTFNLRQKTISTVKKQYLSNGAYLETPESCFFDMILNAFDLLSNYLNFSVEAPKTIAEYYTKPCFIFMYDPCLGPLYAIIAQKIRKGLLHRGAELRLQIAEIEIQNLELQGSLSIQANKKVGGLNKEGFLEMNEKVGRCCLKNVKVLNAGINLSGKNNYWKNEIERSASCCIELKGFSELYAENIEIKGDFHLVVEEGEKVILSQNGKEISIHREPLVQNSWTWSFEKDSDDNIILTKKR